MNSESSEGDTGGSGSRLETLLDEIGLCVRGVSVSKSQRLMWSEHVTFIVYKRHDQVERPASVGGRDFGAIKSAKARPRPIAETSFHAFETFLARAEGFIY